MPRGTNKSKRNTEADKQAADLADLPVNSSQQQGAETQAVAKGHVKVNKQMSESDHIKDDGKKEKSAKKAQNLNVEKAQFDEGDQVMEMEVEGDEFLSDEVDENGNSYGELSSTDSERGSTQYSSQFNQTDSESEMYKGRDSERNSEVRDRAQRKYHHNKKCKAARHKHAYKH